MSRSLIKTVLGQPEPAVHKGKGGYADWVIVAIQGLREYLNHPYQRLLDIHHERPRILRVLGLAVIEPPDFTTIYEQMQRLIMPIRCNLLRLSAELHDTGVIQAIDATGLDRIATSHHYAIRTDYTFTAVKTTALVDCEINIILDIHCEMSKRGDARISWHHLDGTFKIRQLWPRTRATTGTYFATNCVPWAKTRIKHREFDWYGVANNVLLDNTTYHQRSNIKSKVFLLRSKYEKIVQSRTWFGQFHELVLKCAARIVELALSVSNA